MLNDLFDTGYAWLDLIILLGIPVIWYLIVFKSWRESPKDNNHIIGIYSKAGGKRGIYTTKQQDFNINMMLWGALSSVSIFGLAWFIDWLRYG